MSVLCIQNLSKSYDHKVILDSINLHLNQGEIVSILGISGVGKTTLFHAIAGLVQPDQGKIQLEGVDITGQAGHVGYMQQKDLLFPYKKIIDNVSLPLRIRGKSRTEARAIVAPAFEAFGLHGYEHKYPAELSGGMRQRAALLRTYYFSKDVFLLDEPFSALDTITRSEMQQWYLDLYSKIELSTLLITHDMDEAILLSDRIYILSGSPGCITQEITISTRRPRQKDYLLTPEFNGYKRQIIDLLV